MKNYYDILGVTQDASEDDIRKHYRKLAMAYHPDKNPDNPNAEEQFKEIAEAYGVLTDPKKRREYDNFMAAGGSQKQYSGEGFSYSQEDILKDLFRDPRFHQMFNSLLREFQRSGLRASPHFLKKSFFGGKGGAIFGGLFLFGSLAGPALTKSGKKALPKGKGVLKKLGHSFGNLLGMRSQAEERQQPSADIIYQTPVSEEELQNGRWTEVVCYGRNGREVLKVKIPAGSKYGQKLRLKGKGNYGDTGRGDLYLQLIKK